MDSVDFLLRQPFSMQTFGEKIQIKILGSATPDLIIARTNKGRKTVPYAMPRIIGMFKDEKKSLSRFNNSRLFMIT